jgi:hypothetical protein
MLGLLVPVGFALLLHRAAAYERMSPVVWALASVGVTVVVQQGLRLGLLWVFVGQVGLFLLMTWYNGYRKEKGRSE